MNIFGDNNGLKSPGVLLTIHVALNKEVIFLNLSLIIFKIDALYSITTECMVGSESNSYFVGVSKDRLDNMSLN